jgi:hypothetical protein
VLNIHFTYANRLRHFKDASAEEQQKQAVIIQSAENKEYGAIPLTEEKIKAVNTFFDEQRKQMEKRRQDGKETKTN